MSQYGLIDDILMAGKRKKSWNLQLFTILGLEAPP